MDADFLSYYKDNLDFLRHQSEIFAQQYPKLARNIGLSSFECADPFVERILESVAFLSARNELKLDQGSTLLLHDLLSCIAPALGIPHPAVLNLQLSSSLNGGFKTIVKGTQFKTTVKQVNCKFSVLFNVDACPLHFENLQQHFKLEELLEDVFNPVTMKSALSVDFSTSNVSLLPKDIEIYLNLPEHEAGLIAQNLINNVVAVFFQDTNGSLYPLKAPAPHQLTPQQWQTVAQAPTDQTHLQAAGLSPEVIAQAFYNPAYASHNLQENFATGHHTTELYEGELSQNTLGQNPVVFSTLNTLNNSVLNHGLTNSTIINPNATLPIGASSLLNSANPFLSSGINMGLDRGGISSVANAANAINGVSAINTANAANALANSMAGSAEHILNARIYLDDPLNTNLRVKQSILSKSNLIQDVLQISKGMSQMSLYGVYPQLFKYLTFEGLGSALQATNTKINNGRLIFVFDKLQPKLSFNQHAVLSNVVPLINLFQKRSSYTPLTLRSNYHIIPERTQPDDYEVIKVNSVEVLDSNHALKSTALPFFSKSLDPDQIFFIAQRQERAKGTFVPRTPYHKSECFISLCSSEFKTIANSRLNLVASTYCSNADLPVFMKEGHKLTSLDEEWSGKQIDLQLEVIPALLTRSNQSTYALLAYFNLHLQPILAKPQQLLFSLQELLRAYAHFRDNHQLELLSHVLIGANVSQKTLRFIEQGIVFFEQGQQIDLYFDPEKSGGSSLFFVAHLLCHVLKSCSPINQHYLVTAYTKQGEVLATC